MTAERPVRLEKLLRMSNDAHDRWLSFSQVVNYPAGRRLGIFATPNDSFTVYRRTPLTHGTRGFSIQILSVDRATLDNPNPSFATENSEFDNEMNEMLRLRQDNDQSPVIIMPPQRANRLHGLQIERESFESPPMLNEIEVRVTIARMDSDGMSTPAGYRLRLAKVIGSYQPGELLIDPVITIEPSTNEVDIRKILEQMDHFEFPVNVNGAIIERDCGLPLDPPQPPQQPLVEIIQ